jgi:acyl-CoA synthetase (AMP-forming)/AMP-acid ligase II
MTGNVMNLGRLLSDTARRLPDKPALVWGGQSWTWHELDRRVDRLVAALRARGHGHGDPILVLARNSNQVFESMWAAFKLGAVWTPCNFRLEPPEIAYIARSSGAKAMIVGPGFEAHRAAVRDDDNALETFVALDGGGGESYEALIEGGRL